MQEKLLKYVPFKKAFQFLKASKNEMKPQLNKNETKYIDLNLLRCMKHLISPLKIEYEPFVHFELFPDYY